MSTHVVLIDNHDSFVYNLVDAFAVAGVRCTVFRNTVPPEHVMAANPDVICLSPGPGHPRDAGHMMQFPGALRTFRWRCGSLWTNARCHRHHDTH